MPPAPVPRALLSRPSGLLLPNTWDRLHQHLGMCCEHIPTPGTAQESSRAPSIPKAPKSSTWCSRLSVSRLFEAPLEAQSRATAVPGSQAKRYGDGLGETSCYCGHIPLAQGELRIKGCSQGSQPSCSPHKDKQGRTGLEQLYLSLSRFFFWIKCSHTEQICQ